MKTIRFFSFTALCALLLGITPLRAQSLTVTGYVTDDLDQPLVNATVEAVGTATRTLTDDRGYYSIRTQRGATLRFTYSGYEVQDLEVTGSRLDVVLTPVLWVVDEREDIQYEVLKIMPEVRMQESRVVSQMAVADMAYMAAPAARYYAPYDQQQNEAYASFHENRFITVEKDPLSTFALEVDGASYSNMRRMINQGRMPEADAIRTEELVNYFSYNYEKPTGNTPVKISYEVANCPWNTQHRLVRIGVKAREIPSQNLPRTNFVFLIDVSGSMWGATRLDLVKSSLKLLVNNLRDDDQVAIVVYSGAAGEVLPSTPGSDKQKIREALDNLTAGGSTAGGAGIQLAYRVAKQNFIEDGNNRIILCTDGDFNVGVSSNEGLEQLIERERRQSGVFLTVLGYGMGNYKDDKMQILAQKGNGNHAYIDNIQEANRVLVNEFGGTMHTVAKDVKLQIEFNPSKVAAYRLIGYETRLLAHEDFNDDTKDAGELGAGHSVTAFYEVVPAGVSSSYLGSIDPLKYQTVERAVPSVSALAGHPDLMNIKLRYKEPDSDRSSLIEVAVIDNGRNRPSDEFRFAASVAMFGQLVRDSEFKGDATYDRVIEWARAGLSDDEHGYRHEFVRLAQAVKGMAKEDDYASVRGGQ